MAGKTAFAGSTRGRGALGWRPLKMALDPEMQQGEREVVVKKWRRRELGRIVKLALPALSIPLADPIMSLVDSVCIGRYSTTLDLAALGPNLVIFNFVSFSFAFLAITTTIRASRALAARDTREAGRAISTSTMIAFTAGTFFALILFFFPGAALATTGKRAPLPSNPAS
ncbi:hypothetical protein T484DRAFT_1819854 [Baffinella frigidus]|nr:hypothetical protein T484DRAFT_1819854 [Cryptophyta sp. CCMP2293]